MRAELDGLPEIVHGDMFRVQGKPEELVRRKIYCVDRLAQMTLLENDPELLHARPGHPGALHPALESRAAARAATTRASTSTRWYITNNMQ